MSQRCSSGKRVFDSEQLALDALIQNHIVNDYRFNQGPTNVYLCDDCGYWHFTSKASRNPVLDDPEVAKSIEREKRVYNWERGFK